LGNREEGLKWLNRAHAGLQCIFAFLLGLDIANAGEERREISSRDVRKAGGDPKSGPGGPRKNLLLE